ncbi:hypothetical protein CCR75_004852 [Bremia lactucae]|uniref:PH domain-containing protein n=1 Tax=Bremia lactucae TaxID=4779 RepID=A0A976FHB3_BRELC|nr:hypothetical protein CCR75_004852 [Bremia lactucae]
MTSPAIDRVSNAMPLPRGRRRSYDGTIVNMPAPTKCGRSESLRSTWMSNGSDSMAEDPDYDDNNIEVEATTRQEAQPLLQPLSDWVYWQRDVVALPNCWTRVFAVFCGNTLWLYRYEDASAKSLLVCIRVRTANTGIDRRQLELTDVTTLTSVQLYLADASALDRWHSHVAFAIATFAYEVDNPSSRAMIIAPLVSGRPKRGFWKALITAGAAKTKTHEPHTLVVHDNLRRKSFNQRWTSVTTALKSVLHRDRQSPRLEGGRATI